MKFAANFTTLIQIMSPDSEEDVSEVTMEIESGILGIRHMEVGRFNGGRHVYLEYKANNKASAKFEKAFHIAMRVYNSGSSEQELADIVAKCRDLSYLRKREKEYNAECREANTEYEIRVSRELDRWHSNEWYNVAKLLQAARDVQNIEFIDRWM